MKIKGITIWEQYVEFFVLILATVVFVGFTSLQFIGNPNTVTNVGIEYSPKDVDDVLQAEADRIAAGLGTESDSSMKFPPHEAVLPQFQEALGASVNRSDLLVRIGYSFYPDEGPGGMAAEGRDFIDPSLAAPYNVVMKQSFDALRPDVVAAHESLQYRFPEEPYDIAWVTVAAKFNIAEVLEQFKTPGENDEFPFQEHWYNGRIDIMDVKLEREEYLDGVWSNAIVLAPIPGQTSYREDLALEDFNAQDRDDILGDLAVRGVQDAVIRPEFLDTLGQWLPPDPDVGVDDDQPLVILNPEQEKILRLEKRLRNLQRDYNNKMARLTELGGELEPPDNDRGGGAAGGARGGPPGGGGAGPSPGGGDGGRGLGGGSGTISDPRNDQIRIRLTRQTRRLAAQIEALEQQLEDLGAMVDEAPVEIEESPDEFVVWAHDMTIDPGRTYRYRISVEVYNPVFARKLHLPEEQHERADQITIASASSEWTSDLVADEWLKVFMTQAHGSGDLQQPGLGGLGLGDARADVFRFQYGRWWKETFHVEPGDRIGTTRSQSTGLGENLSSVNVDFSTDWFLLDVIEDIEAEREARDRGYAAQALIQSLTRPEAVALRNPEDEILNRVRRRLQEEVELAELADQVAGASAN